MNDDYKKRRLHLTLVDSVKTKKAKHVSDHWYDLCHRLISKPVIVPNKEHIDPSTLKWQLFVPFKMVKEEDGALMNDYGAGASYSRCIANVDVADMLCFDIDNDPKKLNGGSPTTIEDAKVIFAGLSYILYTSYNHLNTYKHNVDKFRVVLPLAYPVTYEEFTERKQALKKMFPFIDLASLSISQPFYVPIAHPDRVHLHKAFFEEGEWFDLFALEATAPTEVKPTAVFETTGVLHDDLPMFKLKGGSSTSADDLYKSLPEGYEHRKGCYRLSGGDKKPGCFVYRKGNGLMYWDPSDTKARFIKVMKQKKVRDLENPHETEVETTPMWVRKPASEGAVKPKIKARPPKIEWVEHPPEIMRLTQRYLPDDLYLRIPNEGITAIRSPKGTGKTFVLKPLVEEAAKNGESVMLLGHRVYLLRNLATRTNLDYYRDLEDGQTTSSMALCMNSLTRINPKEDQPYDTVIIDESEQVFQALTSRTLHGDLAAIFKNLVWLFRNAKRIIFLDADLSSDLTIEMIKEIRGEKQHDAMLGVINDYKIGNGQTTKMYEKRNHLLCDALDAVTQGEKVFIGTNHRSLATIINAIVKDLGKKSLLITAETNEEPDVQDFITTPTEESKKYDVVVASPTLSTGVSIEGNHFTKVYGFFGLNPGTFQDADQAISRVRNCSDVSVWIQGNRETPAIPSEEVLYKEIIRGEKETDKRLYDEPEMMTQGQLLWARIYSRIMYMTKLWSVNKDDQFDELRRELGFHIEFIEEDEDKTTTGSNIYNSFKDVGIDRAKVVFEAAEIEEDEAAELGRKKKRSHDEQLQLERYRLSVVLKDTFSLETIKVAQQQELLQSLAKVRILHSLPDEIRKRDDKEDRLKNKDTFTANRHRVMRHELLQHIAKEAKIDLPLLMKKAQGTEEYEVSRDTMLAVAKAFEARQKDFNFYFGCRIKDPTNDKSIKKVWDSTLGELSLVLERKKRGKKTDRQYKYYLDLSKKSLVHRVMSESMFY